MYISRDEQGHIVRASREPTEECREFVPSHAPELKAFMAEDEDYVTVDLSKTDLAFIRVLEDLLDVLMNKGVISLTELPEAAQDKIMKRQSLRRRLNGLDLVSGQDGDEGII